MWQILISSIVGGLFWHRENETQVKAYSTNSTGIKIQLKLSWDGYISIDNIQIHINF